MEEFPLRGWVHVSQEHDMLHIFRDIAATLGIAGRSDLSINNLSKLIYSALARKKYLIVLDDIWTSNLWDQLKVAIFPDENNGSRVLMTTRIWEVAGREAIEIYNLGAMSEETSLELLLKYAFDGRDEKHYTQEILELAKKIVQKCQGLPLAIRVVGGLLKQTPYSYHQWSMVIERLENPIDHGHVLSVLRSAVEEQPFIIQLCLKSVNNLLLNEDDKIDANTLIQLWIDELLIQPEKHQTMEDGAQVLLEELVNRYPNILLLNLLYIYI
jgi:NB-ARC domain